MRIRQADPGEAEHLLAQSHALMRRLFNPEDNHFYSLDQLRGPEVRFVVAEDGAMIGCGAVALKGGYGEIKSMFTDPGARGRGVAAAILAALAAEARAAACMSLKLETGDLLHDAHRVYGRAAFSICEPFGDYTASPHSVFMEKAL